MTVIPARPEARPVLIAISIEALAYLFILIVTLILRAIALGAVPLGEAEAQQALAAWRLFQPDSPVAGTIESPVAFAAIAASFGLMGFSDAAARLVPMLAGTALVFTPVLFRDRLGRLPSLIASGLLAISPVAVVTSRLAAGYSLSALGFVLALAAISRYVRLRTPRSLTGAGIALGIALAADYASLIAIVAVLLGVAFAEFTQERRMEDEPEMRQSLRDVPWWLPITVMLGTIALVSTVFFLAPEGLGAAADQLGRFAAGVVQRVPGTPWAGLVFALYESGLLLFGLIGMWLASQSPLYWQRMLAGWGFAVLLLVLIYPGALPGHTLWIALPLAALTALTLPHLFSINHEGPVWALWAHAAGVIAACGMIFASLSQYLQAPRLLPFPPGAEVGQITNVPIDLVLLTVWILLIVFLWLITASILGPRAAWYGTGLGIAAVVISLSIGQSGALAFTRADSPYEPLNRMPAQPGTRLLVKTAEEIGQIATGNPLNTSVTVQGTPSAVLAWALRSFTDVTFAPQADPTASTVIVITPADGADPALGSSYVGQDFVIVRQWVPQQLSMPGFVKWVLYRTAQTPASEERVILWVRDDVYQLVPEEEQ